MLISSIVGLIGLFVYIFYGIGPVLLGGFFLLCVLNILLCISYFVSSWFPYMLFLIYLGGILILFSYMCALSLNNNLDSVNKSFYFLIEFFVFSLYSCISWWDFNSGISLLDGLFVDNMVGNSFSVGIINQLGFCWVVMMAGILFFVMALVVEVCCFFAGPLRLLNLD